MNLTTFQNFTHPPYLSCRNESERFERDGYSIYKYSYPPVVPDHEHERLAVPD